MEPITDVWVVETDKGTYPEDPAQVTFWAGRVQKAYNGRMKSYGLPQEVTDEEFLEWWENYLDKRLQH